MKPGDIGNGHEREGVCKPIDEISSFLSRQVIKKSTVEGLKKENSIS